MNVEPSAGPVNPAADFAEQREAVPHGSIPDAYTPLSGSADFDVIHYDLTLDYDVETNRLHGRARLTIKLLLPAGVLTLDLAGLKVTSVNVDGISPRKFKLHKSALAVTLEQVLPAGSTAVLDIEYRGRPGLVSGKWGDAGWEELNDGVLVAGQPIGASTWFPCNDHPSKKATFRICITTDADYRAIANGVLVSHVEESGRAVSVYEQRQPMAPYLATLQIGRYELLPLIAPAPEMGATEPACGEHQPRTAVQAVPQVLATTRTLLPAALEALGRQDLMMRIFSDAFGPYPFDTYTVVVTEDELEIPLEAQSISIFGSNHLSGTWESERLVAHELAHQWFGNSLTVSSWQDIWLHEGFACYAEWIWSEASGRSSAAYHAGQAWNTLRSEPQNLVIGAPGPKRMFDDRVYLRGALALHALRVSAGDDRFFDVLREWTRRYRYGSISTTLFLEHVDRRCGDLPGFSAAALFTPWLFHTSLPIRRPT